LLTTVWSTAGVGPVSWGAAAAYRTLFMTIRLLSAGRRLTVRLDQGEVTLTVTEFDSRLDVRALSVGQLGDLRLAARDIRFGDSVFDRATAVLHNVHLRPAAPPILVAAPVEVTLDVPTAALDDVFRWAAPRLSGDVAADGVARLRLARRPRLGHIEVEARLDGSTLWLTPSVLGVGRSRWRLPGRVPAYPVQLPELPHGLRLTGIELAPHVVRLSGTIPEWRMALPRRRLEELLRQLSVVGVPLNLTRLPLLL
jgi:hypothetical protein